MSIIMLVYKTFKPNKEVLISRPFTIIEGQGQ